MQRTVLVLLSILVVSGCDDGSKPATSGVRFFTTSDCGAIVIDARGRSQHAAHSARRLQTGARVRRCSTTWALSTAKLRRPRSRHSSTSAPGHALSGRSTTTSRRAPSLAPPNSIRSARPATGVWRSQSAPTLQPADDDGAAREGRVRRHCNLRNSNAAHATPVEQALIGALAHRYPDAQPLDPSNSAPVLGRVRRLR